MLRRWRASGLSSGVLPTPYRFVGDDAVRHLVRVALGLESFVVGEREIAGQFNRALAAARGIGVSSAHLNALQTTVGRVGKRVQRLTRFGTASRGVHGLAGDVLRQELSSRGGPPWRVAVVGMGEVGRKAAGLLASDPQVEVVAVNRTIPHEHRGLWIPLEQARGPLLAGCDAIIVSTGSRSPVLGFEDLSVDDKSPVVVIDLGTPAQVSWQGSEQTDTRLIGLDDLLVEWVRPRDDTDLDVVLDLVDDAVQEFRVVCHKRSVGRLLQATQDRYDLLAYRDLPRLLRDGLEGADEAAVRGVEVSVRSAIRSYTNEIIEEIERSSA
jgi:glutamyl-tRNA reductase